MIRGTTPTISFELPFDFVLVEHIWLTITQRGKEIFTKNETDMTVDEHNISVKLTQEETLMLNDSEIVKIQVRVKTSAGDALASNIAIVPVEEILKDGVI